VISYGQNFEDVMLARALADIRIGSYVDVGAHDPEIDSVTNHFYKSGWSGINIEPQVALHEKLIQSRPRDINLNLCVGDFDGHTDFAIVQNRTGWSTSSEDQIKNLKTDRDLQVTIEVIEQKTLTTVLSQHPLGEIHFLKIDVEGNESQVISGIDFSLHRPWIMVVEATVPGSNVPNFNAWEPLLLSAGYKHVYADGLNRFYLADEHSELTSRFSLPPNVFDDFEDQKLQIAKLERDNALVERDRLAVVISELGLQITQLTDHIASQDWELNQSLTERDSLRFELIEFKKSLSWRLTKPLRSISKLINFR
jgi:FkbM family methyltransferase